jgi:hypothetical protein
MLMMEYSYDHQTSNCVVSSMSYRTSNCPLKITVTLQIMLELISRISRMVSLNCPNEPSLTLFFADVALGDSKVKAVPAKVSAILHAHFDTPLFSLNFGYRSVIGKLNNLAQTTRPDIVYTTHQPAKYSSDPRKPHGEAVLYLVRYLKKTCNLGRQFKLDKNKGFQCYCDADFSGNWNKHLAQYDPSTAKSRSGWIVICRVFGYLGIQVADPSCTVH